MDGSAWRRAEMGELAVAIMRGAVAGKLRAAARGKDEQTASALMRAADRYSRGVAEALAGIGAPAPGVSGDAGAGLTLGSHDQARQTSARWVGLDAADWEL